VNLIYLKYLSAQPKYHRIFVGPNRIKKYIRYKIKHRIIKQKIFCSLKHTNILLDFIIDDKLNLILGHYHLYLANNKKHVYAAGRMTIDQFGLISYIDNWSGHYRPSYDDFVNFVKYLKQNFKIRDDCMFNFVDKNNALTIDGR
jgi:hypothetical protein